jgi:hypothetical protein
VSTVLREVALIVIGDANGPNHPCRPAAGAFRPRAGGAGPWRHSLERSLKLTPEQKEQYDLAVGATKRLMLGLTMAAMEAKERLAAELAKSRPDFRSLENLHDEVMENSKTLRREAREEWMKLYAMLDQAQVAELRDFLQRRVDHLGLLHDFLRGMPADARPRKSNPQYW